MLNIKRRKNITSWWCLRQKDLKPSLLIMRDKKRLYNLKFRMSWKEMEILSKIWKRKLQGWKIVNKSISWMLKKRKWNIRACFVNWKRQNNYIKNFKDSWIGGRISWQRIWRRKAPSKFNWDSNNSK